MARRAARSGDYAQAGDFYRLAGNDRKALKMYVLGGHFGQAGQLAEETGDLEGACRYYVQAGDLKAAAEAEIRRENPEKAAYLFGRAGHHYRAAEVLESIGKPAAAAAHYERAGFTEKAARLHHQAGDPLRAARLFERVIAEAGAADPAAARPDGSRDRLRDYHQLCGKLLLQAGEPERAAAHFEEGSCPERAAEAWKTAGKAERAAGILVRLERAEEAAALLQEAGRDLSALGPGLQAGLLSRQGKHREAAEILEKGGNLTAAAEARAEAGDHAGAAELFERDGDLERAADQFVRAGRDADAARCYEEIREFRHAAAIHRGAGRTEDAARVFLKAGEPLEAARIHLDRGDGDRAIGALQTVGPEDPEFPKAAFLLGRVFAERGLHALAAERFLAAIGDRRVEASSVLAYYCLARAQEANRQPREALENYRKVLGFDFSYKDALARARKIEAETPGPDAGAAAPPAPPPPERYRVERRIGEGRLGEVFRAVDRELGRPVAVRRLRERPGESGRAERLRREAAASSRLSHPNILAVLDTGADAEGSFVVTTLAEGASLRELLARGVRFEAQRAVEVGRQILAALEHAHGRGVLHKDLRPENVFVADGDRVTVSDFSLAPRLSDQRPDDPAAARRDAYVAPEVRLGQRVDERSDLYAFGVLLHEMVTGGPPEFLDRVIRRCLEADREMRYPDAGAALRDLKLDGIVAGLVVADRYEVLAEIGRGGMGTVFRARDREIDETVALKFLAGDVTPEHAARLVQEIKTARRILHPNVVRVFTLEKWRDHRFLVMEHIDGLNLARWLERRPAPGSRERLRVGLGVAAGIEAAHRLGILHRDIKPENILVGPAGEPKILDFGIARPETNGHSLTSTGVLVGSPMYVSPEQVQGKPADRATDIYALGAVLYFLFTGRPPFEGGSVKEILLAHLRGRPRPPRDLDASIPPPISDAILRALDPDPGRRFPSAADLHEALTGSGPA